MAKFKISNTYAIINDTPLESVTDDSASPGKDSKRPPKAFTQEYHHMKPPTLAGPPTESPSPERISVVNMRKHLAKLPSHQLDLDRVSLYDAMQKRSNVELLDSLGPKA